MKKIIISLLLLPLVASCGGNKSEKNDSGSTYKESLQDSIKTAQAEIDSCNLKIQEVTSIIDSQINNFAIVENPREVEGYYILKNWKSRYPLQSTGLIARVNKSEHLELSAALKGGTFEQIEVVSGENSVLSSIVPHDQALNYRRDGITTVTFFGDQCNDVCKFIADNELNNITLCFLEKGKKKGSWQIPEEYKKMISATWIFASANSDLHSLELKNRMLHQKIDIIRKHLE